MMEGVTSASAAATRTAVGLGVSGFLGALNVSTTLWLARSYRIAKRASKKEKKKRESGSSASAGAGLAMQMGEIELSALGSTGFTTNSLRSADGSELHIRTSHRERETSIFSRANPRLLGSSALRMSSSKAGGDPLLRGPSKLPDTTLVVIKRRLGEDGDAGEFEL